MILNPSELLLLEDCQDDWQGLWEAGWTESDDPVERRVALVTNLVAGGFLEVLSISDWSEAKSAAALQHEESLAIVTRAESYGAPHEGHVGHFFVLSITPKGNLAVAACHN